ncbi:MAG: polysaccharide biosynthesis C-terminal domain-containing protein [Pseudomonadota bacterium]
MRKAIARVLGGSALFFVGRIAGAVATYVVQILLARWIGRHELGEYVEAFAWCLILSDVALFGFPFAGLRFIGEDIVAGNRGRIRGFVRRTRQITLGMAIALAAGGCATILVTMPISEHPEVRALLVALITLPALTLLRHYTAVAHAFAWFSLVVAPMTVLRPILLLAVVTLLWAAGVQLAAHGVMALHAGVVVILLVGLGVIVHKRLSGELGNAPPTYQTRMWTRTASPLLIVSLFNGFFPEINVVILGLIATDGDVAIFNAGIRTAFFIGFGLYAVDQAIMPRVSQLFAGGDLVGMQRLLVLATRLKFGSAVVGAAVLGGFGESILAAFGNDFVVGYQALLVLIATQVVRAMIGPVAQLLGITGHQDKSLAACAASIVAILILDALLVPGFGIVGASLSALAVTTLSSLWMLRLVVRHIGVVPAVFGRTT